jgi:glyoxylase-like metal-dependent hydrolase (beta-lactamase superfamily II)
VLPVVEAGLAQMVEGSAELEDGLKITPAPGHTPGTIRIEFESQGEKALFCGDILHHAVQVFRPEWNSFACLDQDNARESRRAALEHCAGSRRAADAVPFRRAVPPVTSTTREADSRRASPAVSEEERRQ